MTPGRDLRAIHSPPPDQHVMPTLGGHEPDPSCWCHPIIDYTDPVNEGRVWVHQALA